MIEPAEDAWFMAIYLSEASFRNLSMSPQTETATRRPMGYASGVVVGIILPLAILLFGLTSPVRALALIFLLVGAWTILFGTLYQREKAYWAGWGAGLAVLSSVAVLPFAYTIGLVLVVVVVLIIATAFLRRDPR
jgi:hypothetical protein